jgi:RNA polymerase sigma-70 factor (ECF subfamily)
VPAPDAEARAEPEAGDDIGMLRAALARLSTEQRLLLSLRYADGVPLRVIAEIFGIPEGTAKSRLFAARDALRAMLPRRQDEPTAKE